MDNYHCIEENYKEGLESICGAMVANLSDTIGESEAKTLVDDLVCERLKAFWEAVLEPVVADVTSAQKRDYRRMRAVEIACGDVAEAEKIFEFLEK